MSTFISVKFVRALTILGASLFMLFSTASYSSNSLIQINTAEHNDAHSALLQAIADATSRLKKFKQAKQAIELTQTSEDINGNVYQRHFTPATYEKNDIVGAWQTIRADEKFNQSITVSDDILFESDNFDINGATLVSETSATWTFQIANMINVESEDESVEQELEQLDSAMAEHLFTEITISKDLPQVKSLKIYAASSFKPSWMLTIDKFELRLTFNQAWPGGPMIRKNMTRHVKGKYGWLISLDELVTTETSEVVKVTLHQTEQAISANSKETTL